MAVAVAVDVEQEVELELEVDEMPKRAHLANSKLALIATAGSQHGSCRPMSSMAIDKSSSASELCIVPE